VLHLTQRVAWHDRQWDGAVCDRPGENSFCIALDRIRSERDDGAEEARAGTDWAELAADEIPPCRAEAGAFMSPREWPRLVAHPYQKQKKTLDTHGHLEPTTITASGYSTFAVPFSSLMRGKQEEIAERSPNNLPEDREPPFPTTWVFGSHRQEALLERFFEAIENDTSLVFFYTKEGQPVSEAINRLVVGVGRVTKVGPLLYYDRPPEKPAYPIWDREIHHSIRPHGNDGFLLPYHHYLAATGDPEEDARRRALLSEILVVPDRDHTGVFSYFSEHASADVALSVLVTVLDSVRRIREHGVAEGEWESKEEWLNQQIARAWTDRGAFPGLGSALEAVGMRMGTALALELIASGQLSADADPWLAVNALLRGQADPPQSAYAGDLEAVRGTWAKLTEERRALLELLSRFALSPDQAKRWFDPAHRASAAAESISDREVLENPYRIAECDLGAINEPAITIGAIDRGLFPDDAVAARAPIPEQSRVDSATDRRRVRAAIVNILQAASERGDSLLSSVEALTRLQKLDLSRPCVVPLDWFPGNEEFLESAVEQSEAEVPGPEPGGTQRLSALQLATHADTERRLARILLKRAAKGVTSVGAGKWRDLLIESIRSAGAEVDLGDPRHVDALAEQEAGLEAITTRRLGVLVGRAGTGKTSVLGALVRCEELAKDGVLLLAPTGKARVRLQRATGREASTIAQFLYRLQRYDATRQRPLFGGQGQHRKEKTVVIDECSMMTMDDLYAVVRALDLGHVERLILVGDPNQLPPIGVGRPFADLVGVLDEPASEEERAAAPILSRLTVEVRTALGGPSDALRLAAWFTNEPQPKDADRVLSDLELGAAFNDLEIVTWKTPADLRRAIGEQLQKQVGLDGPTDVDGFDRALGLDEKGWIPFDEPDGVEGFQVISPVRMHPYGVRDLNRWLQATFRSGSNWRSAMGEEHVGRKDKVIQLRNQKKKAWSPEGGEQEEYLANGEIGTVAKHDGKWLKVAFAGRPGVTFSYRPSTSEQPALELAYALTVHKAQGSDFGIVFFIVPQTRMLSRELLYTGLTRAKEKLVLFVEGEDSSPLYQLTLPSRSETARRNTNLFRSVVRDDAEAPPFAEHLIHRVSDGRMVRSKSELAVAIELQRLGMWDRCAYERPLDGVVASGRLRPDFSFVDAAGDVIVWEHLGMLNKKSYLESWEWKLTWYEKNGFVLGENLFTTEDDPSGGLDQGRLTKVAKEIDELL
jgi:hypothetical protein